ncbi:hypothetical protein BDM02DRAFT_3191755 [Thelephora ganbajun]|uniref:Uncharacterized protein n=1 Tax=Thelephora ganbajun TaxID=370292 RepID=A0ACB6Z1F9_THEGA|nr:hypothetical protein BDM02DRAFT_3191755 [Thelephora ganbajun]
MQESEEDPFFKDFFWRLKEHLLSQVLEQKANFTNQDMLDLTIDGNNRIYRHQTLQVNYTSYDLQRHSDVINIRTQLDLMMLSEAEDHTHP